MRMCDLARSNPHSYASTILPRRNNRYLTAYGLTGEPTPPVIGSAGATNMNS